MQALKEAKLFQAQLEQIVNAEIKLKLMVDHTLALSELESGFVKFEKTKQNVRGFAERCVKSIEPFIQRHAIRFFFPEQPLFADFDPRLMEEDSNDLILRMALSLPPGEVIEIGGSKDEEKITFIVSCKSYAIESGHPPPSPRCRHLSVRGKAAR